MTTQTPTPTDNERLARLEGAFEQFGERLTSVENQVSGLRADTTAGDESLRKAIVDRDESLRKAIVDR